ncbi:MAG: hypothetical protein ACI4MF_12295 [Candidatus Faecivicinus sp.]
MRLNQWITDGKPLELCDELADLGSLAALAGEYRDALGSADSDRLDDLTRRVRVLLLPKSEEDRLGALLLFHSENDLSERLEQMYLRLAGELHWRSAPVGFSDGKRGLCIRMGDLLVYPYQLLKNETGVHLSGDERCAVSALPLAAGVASEGYSFEAFVHPEESGHRPHRFASCVRAIRGGLTCESLTMRSSALNRDLALSALDARLKRPAVPADLIRDYDFLGGILTDRRLGQDCGIGDLIPLFESLLLAD